MFNSWICGLVAINVLVLFSIFIFALLIKPTWVIYSKYQVLSDIQFGIFFCIFLLFGALYETEDSEAAKICIIYIDTIKTEIPATLIGCLVLLAVKIMILHSVRWDLLYDISKDALFLPKVDKILLNNIRFLLLILNIFVFYIGSLFSYISCLVIFLLPCEAKKKKYFDDHIEKNSERYLKGTVIIQIIIVFKSLIFSIFTVKNI